MTVREMEKMVREFLNPKKVEQKPVEESKELKDLVGNMQRAFAAKVSAGQRQQGTHLHRLLHRR